MVEDTPIEYRFLNMDKREFAASQEQLINDVGRKSTIRSIPNYEHNQVLVVAGRGFFTECQAILLCRELAFSDN